MPRGDERRPLLAEAARIELLDECHAAGVTDPIEGVAHLDAAGQHVTLPGQCHRAQWIADDAPDPGLMAEVVPLETFVLHRVGHVREEVQREGRRAVAGSSGSERGGEQNRSGPRWCGRG